MGGSSGRMFGILLCQRCSVSCASRKMGRNFGSLGEQIPVSSLVCIDESVAHIVRINEFKGDNIDNSIWGDFNGKLIIFLDENYSKSLLNVVRKYTKLLRITSYAVQTH